MHMCMFMYNEICSCGLLTFTKIHVRVFTVYVGDVCMILDGCHDLLNYFIVYLFILCSATPT